MFGCNMDFRVVTRHNESAAWHIADILRSLGIKIMDLREADIVADADGSKRGSAYILCCKGSNFAYRRLMKVYSYDEILYEGVKTLI